MEDLIVHAHILFQSSTSSPPLPPAPIGEPVPLISYGSSHTKIAEMPPPPLPQRSASPDRRPKDLPAHPTPPPTAAGQAPPDLERAAPVTEDFTPQLPPRPTNSIHPSLRAGPMSGLPSRQSLPPPARNAQWFDESISFADVAPAAPSVPPSPSRRAQRPAPSPLPLKSPWSESQPSLVSSTNPSITSISIDEPDASRPPTANVISLNDDLPLSAPSNGTSFSSAVSPTTSMSSGRQTPVTPPMSSKSLIPSSPPSVTTASPSSSPGRHRKAGSSSSAE